MDSNIKAFAEEEYAPSLPVPNVQEMVRRNPLQLPERYTRNREEMQNSIDNYHLSFEIPVIDLSLLSKGDKAELNKLDLACKDSGFFQVITISAHQVNKRAYMLNVLPSFFTNEHDFM
jgi:hypothetical protein